MKTRATTFAFMLSKFDPAKPSPADHEKKAAMMWGTITSLAEQGDLGEAKTLLEDLLQRYWRTGFVRDQKAEIIALRSRLA